MRRQSSGGRETKDMREVLKLGSRLPRAAPGCLGSRGSRRGEMKSGGRMGSLGESDGRVIDCSMSSESYLVLV